MKGYVEYKPKNKKFSDRFIENASLTILSKEFQDELITIRNFWGIPKIGFKNHKSNKFIKWLGIQKGNDFKMVSVIFEKQKIIKCKPKYFLNKVLSYLEDNDSTDGYPTDLYFLESIKTFDALINEKPFPGIVHFILFNEIFVPESNELLLKTSKKYKYPILVFGPNATDKDFRDIYPIICSMQKSWFKNCHKNKIRKKRNFPIALNILKNPNKTSYDIMEDHNISDNAKNSKANLNRINQIRRRTKISLN